MQPFPATSQPACSVQSAALSHASEHIEATWPVGERSLRLTIPTRPGTINSLRDGLSVLTP